MKNLNNFDEKLKKKMTRKLNTISLENISIKNLGTNYNYSNSVENFENRKFKKIHLNKKKTEKWRKK